jgi:hypothetical protein
LWIALNRYERKQPLPNELCGGICEIEILQVTNFDANIRSTRTCSIFIAWLQNSRSNWMAGDIIIGQAEVAMEHAQHFSLTTESSCCDFGIIKFAGSLIAFCKESGSLLRSAREKSLTSILSLCEKERRTLAST